MCCLHTHSRPQAGTLRSPAAQESLDNKDMPTLQQELPEDWQQALALKGWGPVPLSDWLTDLALNDPVSLSGTELAPSMLTQLTCPSENSFLLLAAAIQLSPGVA